MDLLPQEGNSERNMKTSVSYHGLIRKYKLDICRRCFRERSDLLGFTQTK